MSITCIKGPNSSLLPIYAAFTTSPCSYLTNCHQAQPCDLLADTTKAKAWNILRSFSFCFCAWPWPWEHPELAAGRWDTLGDEILLDHLAAGGPTDIQRPAQVNPSSTTHQCLPCIPVRLWLFDGQLTTDTCTNQDGEKFTVHNGVKVTNSKAINRAQFQLRRERERTHSRVHTYVHRKILLHVHIRSASQPRGLCPWGTTSASFTIIDWRA